VFLAAEATEARDADRVVQGDGGAMGATRFQMSGLVQ
jgi:hypothetical protein